MRRPFGCLSGVGLVATLIAVFAIGGLIAATGGALFSPGALSAKTGPEPVGGVTSHAETGGNCAACHTPPWSPVTMGERCSACHMAMIDPQSHLAQFHALLWTDVPEQPCRACHPEHRGADAPLTDIAVADFPHDGTGFSLAAHRESAEGVAFECEDCHADGLTAFAVDACDRCHAERDAAFMAAHRLDFGGECLGCHDGADRFSGFDHSRVTFPLEGAHAPLTCRECHTAEVPDDFAEAPAECISCHQEDDAHGGGLGDDCGACHTPEEWEAASFDHQATDFPLTGEHAGATCEDCHAGGRYEGTPTECVGCHREDDAHAGELGEDCAACHTSEDWEKTSYDHANSQFPLEGRHVDVECGGCHADARFKSAPTECAACHREDDAHAGELGEDCAACHRPDDWRNATFDHAQSRFPLTGAHVQAQCRDCHEAGQFRNTPTACSGCHQDPAYHRGAFSQACDACHVTDAWQPARFELPHVFPIAHGAAAASSCRTCHPDALATYTCYGCHDHNPAETVEEHADEGLGDIADCARCHPTGQEDEAEGGED